MNGGAENESPARHCNAGGADRQECDVVDYHDATPPATAARRGDGFTRQRLAWLDAVMADPAVTAAGFRLAYAISGFINRATGDAWPSQETLAARLGMTPRNVRNLIDQLAARGHLTIIRSKGRGNVNRYRLARTAPEKRNGASAFRPEKQERAFPFSEREKRKSSVGKEERDFRQNPIEEPFDGEKGEDTPYSPPNLKKVGPDEPPIAEPIGVRVEVDEAELDLGLDDPPAMEEPGGGDAAFEAFWRLYPRHVAKPKARMAFRSAVKRAPVETILAAAERFAIEREGQEERFTPHPATGSTAIGGMTRRYSRGHWTSPAATAGWAGSRNEPPPTLRASTLRGGGPRNDPRSGSYAVAGGGALRSPAQG